MYIVYNIDYVNLRLWLKMGQGPSQCQVNLKRFHERVTIVRRGKLLPSSSFIVSYLITSRFVIMAETQEEWYNRQAIEQLAQHIPFERDSASRSEQIEMLRGLVLRYGRTMDPEMFGFEARDELQHLGLWDRIGPES